jgi:hypothetical protein
MMYSYYYGSSIALLDNTTVESFKRSIVNLTLLSLDVKE